MEGSKPRGAVGIVLVRFKRAPQKVLRRVAYASPKVLEWFKRFAFLGGKAGFPIIGVLVMLN